MNFIQDYLKMTGRSESPQLYRKWVAISIVSTALKRRIQYHLDRPIFPNMFIVLVGDPGAMKGTAIHPAKEFLKKAGVWTASESGSEKGIGMGLKIAEKKTGTPSIVFILDEFSLFVEGKEKTIIPRLCQLWDNEDWSWATEKSGVEIIPNISTALLGAIQPQTLRERATMVSTILRSGLSSRILFVHSNETDLINHDPGLTEHELKLKENLLNQITQISQLDGHAQMTNHAKSLYQKWSENFIKSGRNESGVIFRNTALSHYAQRRRVHLIKLAITLAASQGEIEIGTPIIKNAISILNELEKTMLSVWYGTGVNPLGHIISEIRTILETRKQISRSDLGKTLIEIASKKELNEALETLQESGIIDRFPRGWQDHFQLKNDRF
jgi:hypothetical protein